MTTEPDTTEPSRDTEVLIGTTLGGRYEVIGRLGKGGAGHVYLGIQQPLGREVAIKVLRADLSPVAHREFSARFLREAEAVAGLRHPNVVTVFDYGVDGEGDDELRFVVMERLRGERLTDRIRRGPMPGPEVAGIGAGIARGLRHAHGKGLVHRDVKPSNVILEPGDDGIRPVLLDFGLVKPEEEEDEEGLTRVGTYMGTPSYMAPEQARGDGRVDARSDVYSLGCVMFKMLAGMAPYQGKNALAIALAHTAEPVPRIASRNPEVTVDEDLEAIVLRCIAKKPDERWPDAAALATALERWRPLSERSAVVAAPRRAGAGRWLAAVLGLGLFGLGGLGVAGGAVWLAASTTGERPAADEVALGPPGAPTIGAEGEDEEVEPDEPSDEETDGTGEDEAPLEADATPPSPEPSPEREPEPAPAPAPERVPAPKPAPAPAKPAPAPRPKVVSAPRPQPVVAVTADGVEFDAPHAARALAWINSVDEPTLRQGGVYGRGVNIILEQRPFASLEAFAATPYIGEKTVQAVHQSTKE